MGNINTFNNLIVSEENPEEDRKAIEGTMPYVVIAAYKKIPPEIFDLTLEELESRADIGYHDSQVKTAFWKTYKQATKARTRMTLTSIMISTSSNVRGFRNRFLKNPAKLAWLLTPITPYQNHVDTLLDKSVERYQELISMDITTTKKLKYKDDDGVEHEKIVSEVDSRKAMVLLSVIKNLEERSLGSSIQRNVSINASEPKADKDSRSEIDMDAVNKKLLELESKLGSEPVTIEVDNE